MSSVSSTLNRIRDRMSIRQQSALLTALLSLATVTLMTGFTAYVARDRAATRASSEMRDLARTMADRLDADMFERYREIGNYAALPLLADSWARGEEHARSFLNAVQKSLPSYAWIGFASAEGTVLASTQGMLEGRSVADRPWFKAGLAAPVALDLHEAKLLAGLLGPSPDGGPFRFVDVAAPVRDSSGKVTGVLGAHLSWSWAQSVRVKLLSGLDPALETELLVTSADGRVLLGATYDSEGLTRPLLAQSQDGPVMFTDSPDGRDSLAAVVATRGLEGYKGLGWRVVARRPRDIALAGANRIAMIILAIGTAAALASMAAASFIAGRVTRPLDRLTANADRIGRDPQMALFDRQGGASDILHLCNALRSLTRRIDFAEHSLSDAREHIERLDQEHTEEALRHTAIVSTLREMANSDALTGLLNRRGFLAHAVDVLEFFRRYRRSFAILMVDIDHFKKVNDSYGHACGDAVIQAVGRTLADAARKTDRVARFGGEEFVVLLREVDGAGAMLWAERVRETIQATVVESGGHRIRVTASLGVTLALQSDRDVEDIVHRADRALYLAKSNGRDRVRYLAREPGEARAA